MVTATTPRRMDVVLVRLDPTVGHEMRKTRPCVVVSPDELNGRLATLIVAPLTSTRRSVPWRVDSTFRGKRGQVALDQLRTIDRTRVARNLGALDSRAGRRALEILQEMFAA